MKVTKSLSKAEFDSYAPASCDCWILFAKAIMESYALQYICQLPTNATSQQEYEILDTKKYAPVRKAILERIKEGPLRRVVDYHAIAQGLEFGRLENKRKLGIPWKEVNYENRSKM